MGIILERGEREQTRRGDVGRAVRARVAVQLAPSGCTEGPL